MEMATLAFGLPQYKDWVEYLWKIEDILSDSPTSSLGKAPR